MRSDRPHRRPAPQYAGRIPSGTAPRRGAALYSLVMANALLVGVIGLSALLVLRVQRRSVAQGEGAPQARACAAAAMELAARTLNRESNWRTIYAHDQLRPEATLGAGTLTWKLVDPTDTNLADEAADPVDVHAIGRSGEAAWAISRRYSAVRRSALDHPLHCGDRLHINGGKTLTVEGAAASTNGELDLDGALTGDGECDFRTGNGTLTGIVTEDAPAKRLPGTSAFDSYRAIATEIPYSGRIDGAVLGPGVNTYAGGVNSQGLYYINCGNNELEIRNSRLLGTLIVRGNCRIETAAQMQNHLAEHPVLLVSGDLKVELRSATQTLREADFSRNFNPAGMPWQGTVDTDKVDEYPNEIRGLIAVGDDLELKESPRIYGVVLVNDDVLVDGLPQIVHNPELSTSPPLHFDIVDYDMRPQTGGVVRQPAP